MTGALEAWSDFNVAMAGASAALAGLVIVAASVNIEKIVGARHLTARLAASIAGLVLALVVSAAALVPELALFWYGVVILGATLLAALFQVHATRMVLADPRSPLGVRIGKAVPGIVPLLCYLAAGITVTTGHPSGLPLTAAGCLLMIAAAILVSWIVLVEVLR